MSAHLLGVVAHAAEVTTATLRTWKERGFIRANPTPRTWDSFTDSEALEICCAAALVAAGLGVRESFAFAADVTRNNLRRVRIGTVTISLDVEAIRARLTSPIAEWVSP